MSILHHGRFGILPLLPGGAISLGSMVMTWGGRGTGGHLGFILAPVLADPPGLESQHTFVADALSLSVASGLQATPTVSSSSRPRLCKGQGLLWET